jgi:hypothetical protein
MARTVTVAVADFCVRVAFPAVVMLMMPTAAEQCMRQQRERQQDGNGGCEHGQSARAGIYDVNSR